MKFFNTVYYINSLLLNFFLGILSTYTFINNTYINTLRACTSSFLIIRFHCRLMFHSITNHLMTTNTYFHAFIPPKDKSYKVIIRNLYHTTLISDIPDASSELGHLTRRVTNVIQNPCPLFRVELNPNINNKEILNLSSILYVKSKSNYPIGRIVVHFSVKTARTTITQKTIVIIIRVVSSVRMTTLQAFALKTKAAQPSALFERAIIRTSNYKEY